MTNEQGADVVIVGKDGTEHIFPSGFDPQKAAAIVRGGTPGAPVFGAASTPSAEDMLARRTVNAHEGEPTAVEQLNEAMQGPAHPTSLSDIGQLLSAPTDATRSVTMGILRRIPSVLKATAQNTQPGLVSKLSFPLRAISEFNETMPSTMAQRVREFKGATAGAPAAPPTQAAPSGPDVVDRALMRGRPDAARAFNDQPLAVQMRDLPATGAVPERTRAPIPVQPQQIPFHELPLAQQMPQLPTSGTTPIRGRLVMPVVEQQQFRDLPLYKQMEQLPQTPAPQLRGRMIEPPIQNLGHETRPVTAPAPAPAPESSAPSTLSPTDRVSLQKQGYRPELIARIEQRLAGVQPMASHPPVSPLRQPRMDVGAEVVGRQQGMPIADVRQATGPIVDEAPGDASPILPQSALHRIIDDMKALPPGAEREAYVARATSGKTKWQVENLRRTLEHLGLTVPPMALAVREAVAQRLMPSHATEGR